MGFRGRVQSRATHMVVAQVVSVGRLAATVSAMEVTVEPAKVLAGVGMWLEPKKKSHELPAHLAPSDVLEIEYPLPPNEAVARWGKGCRALVKVQVGRQQPASRPLVFELPLR